MSRNRKNIRFSFVSTKKIFSLSFSFNQTHFLNLAFSFRILQEEKLYVSYKSSCRLSRLRKLCIQQRVQARVIRIICQKLLPHHYQRFMPIKTHQIIVKIVIVKLIRINTIHYDGIIIKSKFCGDSLLYVICAPQVRLETVECLSLNFLKISYLNLISQ